MGCKAREFGDVDRKKWDFVKVELKAMGLTVPEGPVGAVQSIEIGLDVNFEWLESQSLLRVQVVKKPVFIPCGYIYHRLERAILTERNEPDPDDNMADFM